MVDLVGAYDASAEASTGFEPLPPGQYVARIVDAKRNPISRRNDNGDCLNLTWKVDGGEHDGRLFWQRINLWLRGSNEAKVREIANAQFAAVREATGVPMPKSTDELLERPCLVTLKIKRYPGYPERNEVTSVKPVGGGGVPANRGAAPLGQTPRSEPANVAAPAPKKANPFARAAGR